MMNIQLRNPIKMIRFEWTLLIKRSTLLSIDSFVVVREQIQTLIVFIKLYEKAIECKIYDSLYTLCKLFFKLRTKTSSKWFKLSCMLNNLITIKEIPYTNKSSFQSVHIFFKKMKQSLNWTFTRIFLKSKRFLHQ